MAGCTPLVSLRTFDLALNGLKSVTCLGDGYTVILDWYKYYQTPTNWPLYYNLYWSSNHNDVFREGVKFVVTSDKLEATIHGGFRRGNMYYFAIKAAVFEPGTFLYEQLPEVDGFKMYSESSLREDISATDLVIPLMDASLFPASGIILIGAEPIAYSAIDYVDNNLILLSTDQRGIYGYDARPHYTDGYDGVETHSPIISLWIGFQDTNTAIGTTEIRFFDQYARTNEDGFKERKDILSGTKNLNIVDADNVGFPAYDQSSYHRTFMPDYLSGNSGGTYFGGEYGCPDGDGPIRAIGIQDMTNMREEYILQSTGKECSLFSRQWSGKDSKYYNSGSESPAYRGLDNFGTPLVSGYTQFFNPRRSDGRILVRFGPTKEEYKREEGGIENTFIPACWTLVTPIVKDGDFVIRYNKDGTEEWRYEITDVERNDTFLGNSGIQKFTCIRVRKTDPIYQVKVFADSSMYPSEVLTSIGSVPGPGGIPPHMHRVVISEKILSVRQISQMTSKEYGHNHVVERGVVSNVLEHSHSIIL